LPSRARRSPVRREPSQLKRGGWPSGLRQVASRDSVNPAQKAVQSAYRLQQTVAVLQARRIASSMI
jgi:hypothetical protein